MTRVIFQRTIVNDAGDIQPGATVEVLDETTGLAPSGGIWDSRTGGSTLSNPFTADSNGFAQFYVEPGRYRVIATSTSGTITWRNIDLVNNDTISKDTEQLGSVTLASNVYTFTPDSGVFRPLVDGLVIKFFLPATANTAAVDINYNGTTVDFTLIEGTEFGSGDLDDTYNKQMIVGRYDGTAFRCLSDIRGNNVNGDWERKANGIQTCSTNISDTAAIDTAFFGGFRSSGLPWSYPKFFSTAPIVNAAEASIDAFGVCVNNPTTTVCNYIYTSVSTQTSAAREINLRAIGPWY